MSLVVATSLISAGIFAASAIWENARAEDEGITDIMPVNEPPYQVKIDENTTPSQFEEEMRKRLVSQKVEKPKIPVSDQRLDKIQEAFSLIEQPFEKPLEKPKKGQPDKMSIDPLTGDAKYTNGIVINREGRAIKIPEDASPSKGQTLPVVRVMVEDIAEMTKKPYTTQLAYDVMKQVTELQKYMDSLDLIEVTGILVEINTYITEGKDSFDKAAALIQEVDRLVNFDKIEEEKK
ncbi:hypothetical protein JQN58_10280 [Aneurinibacillus sp. BA2021]|nr:hypothetical protein [Aneurinibacillus sp. BA2021]